MMARTRRLRRVIIQSGRHDPIYGGGKGGKEGGGLRVIVR